VHRHGLLWIAGRASEVKSRRPTMTSAYLSSLAFCLSDLPSPIHRATWPLCDLSISLSLRLASGPQRGHGSNRQLLKANPGTADKDAGWRYQNLERVA
jgi:hypothetical protein